MKKSRQGSKTDLTFSSKPRGFYDVLVQTCVKSPCNIAVRECNDGKYTCYTYSELYGVCEYIAQNLQQMNCNKGIVGLVSQRNIIVPCAIAAAHKCCTGFMFLDPTAEVAYDIQFTVMISIFLDPEQSISSKLSKKPDKVLTVFNYTLNFYDYGPPTDELYRNMVEYSFICQTSGSTGEPKNIQVPIECIQPNIDDLTTLFRICPEDVIFFSTPLTFDPSMVEILLACKNGASLLIAPDKADVLFPCNKEHSVTVWQTTPSKFFQYDNTDLRTRILSGNSTLKVLALGGEPFRGLKRLKQIKSAKNETRIFTLYGVTEMSCWACAAELDLNKYSCDREIPLGQSLSETQVIVKPELKESSQGKIVLVSKTRRCIILNKVQTGVEQNSLKFIDTGDLGEIKNGTIYYRGRTDDQIKRFGHKVNLLFIESVIHQCPKVKACSCIWIPKPSLLVVYFSSETITSNELSDFLKCKLDDKHWPDKVIRLNHFPTNPHGKTSKVMLRNMYNNMPPTLSDLKVKLLQEIKGFSSDNITYDDIKNKNFYAIGGTSFRAVTICNKISLTDPHFGKFLLTQLMVPKVTIDQIMKTAEQTFCKEDMVAVLPKVPDALKLQKKGKSSATKRSSSHVGSESTGPQPKKVEDTPTNDDTDMVLLWSYDTGKCVDASPSLFEYNLSLYVAVGSHSGKIVVLDALYGDCSGLVDVNSRIEAAVYCFYDNDSGFAYGVVGTYDGTIVCFRIDNCEVKWRTNIDSMVKSKATRCKQFLYVAAYDGNIHCMNLTNGEVVQSIQIGADQPISADLVLVKNKYLLTGTLSGVCACVNTETNVVMWRVPLNSPLFAAPVVYDDEKYVVYAEVNGNIMCRTVEKGITIWKFSCVKGNIFSSCYITNVGNQSWQIIFGCHDHNVYCITVKNYLPSLTWKCLLSSPVYSTPMGLNSTMILAAETNGKLSVINTENGKVLSCYNLPADTFSSPAVYSDYIYIGCRDDQLHALRYVPKT